MLNGINIKKHEDEKRMEIFSLYFKILTGTHESLVKEKDKKYAELWEAQAQYYTVVDKNKEQLA